MEVKGMTISSKLLLENEIMGVLLVPQPHTGSKQQCSKFVSLGPVYRRVDMHHIYIDLDNIEFTQG